MAQEVRQRLLAKGFTRLPRCPLCGDEQAIRDFASHTRQCERDALSQIIDACDRALARWWSQEPSSEEERETLDRAADLLRAERVASWDALMSSTPWAPGFPHDGMPF